MPEDLDAIDVPAGTWAVFRTAGLYPAALQSTWAATTTDWFPSDRASDVSTATCELWRPVERA